MHRVGVFALMLLLLALLAGCKQDLYTKLSEADANDMLEVLLSAQVDASKSSPDGKTWNVTVDADQMGPALVLLRANGLPGAHRASLGDMFKKDGLISTPTEERVRFIYGVSQELEKTLSSIDGVVVARVHVVLPNNDPLAETVRPSSASVFIKHKPDANVVALVPVVKNLVMRSVEGLRYDNVNVTVVAATPTAAAPGDQLPRRSGWSSALPALLGLLVLGGAAGGGFFWWRKRSLAQAEEEDGEEDEARVHA